MLHVAEMGQLIHLQAKEELLVHGDLLNITLEYFKNFHSTAAAICGKQNNENIAFALEASTVCLPLIYNNIALQTHQTGGRSFKIRAHNSYPPQVNNLKSKLNRECPQQQNIS